MSKVFEALRKAKLQIKPVKCAILNEQINFLGHILSTKGIAPDPNKLKVLQDLPFPKNYKEMQSFLGLVQWFKRFVHNLAVYTLPLYQISSKDKPYEITEERKSCFETIKKKLLNPPVLRFPCYDPDCKFLLQTDASDYAVGGILIQQRNAERWVIAYYSHQLNKAERRYSTVERECLALVKALKHYRYYLIGRKVYVESDHKPLAWIKTSVSKNNRLQRWAVALMDYNYEISYIPGCENTAADFLSRINPENREIKRNLAAITSRKDKTEEKEEKDIQTVTNNLYDEIFDFASQKFLVGPESKPEIGPPGTTFLENS